MGRFFVNFQVHAPATGDGEAGPLHDRLRERLLADGFVVARDDGQPARRIAVARSRTGPWRTVFDSQTGSQDPDAVDDSGARLSQASGRHVLSLLAHDDDFLEMKLFHQGRRLSTVNSWPGYFEGRPRAAPEGDFEAWAALLPPPRTVAQLRQAWQPQEPPGDVRPLLQRVAALLDLDVERCLQGPDVPAAEADEFISLRVLAPDNLADASRRGQPAGLGHEGGVAGETVLPLGGRTRIEAITHSTGAGGAGLQVLAWGKALDAGLVAVRDASLALGLQAPLALALQGRLLMARLPASQLPPGFAGPAEAFAQAGQATDHGLDLWLSSRLALVLDLEAIAAGEGELQLAVQSLDHPDALAHWRTRVRVAVAGQ
jgi:hypothetical protein